MIRTLAVEPLIDLRGECTVKWDVTCGVLLAEENVVVDSPKVLIVTV